MSPNDANWERREPRIVPSRAHLLAILAEAGYRDPSVLEFKALSGGLGNACFRVVRGEGAPDLLLRIYTRNGSACLVERDLFLELRRRQLTSGPAALPIPEILYSDPEGTRLGYPCSLMTWLPGGMLRDALPELRGTEAATLFYEIGSVLARLSVLRFTRCGQLGPGLTIIEEWGSPADFAKTFLLTAIDDGDAGRRLDASTRRDLRKLVEEDAARLHPLHDRYSLIHGDFKDVNLLVAEGARSWSLSGVVDWEFASSAPSIVDVATFLRMRDLHGDLASDAFACGFVDAGGDLTEDWRWQARLMDLISLCGFLNEAVERPAVTRDARKLVERTLRERSALEGIWTRSAFQPSFG